MTKKNEKPRKRTIKFPPSMLEKRGTGKLPCGHSRMNELSNGACVRCAVKAVMKKNLKKKARTRE